MESNRYKLIKEYPGRQIGDIALYDPLRCSDNFIWEKDGAKIPRDFQPDINHDWFTGVSGYLIMSFKDVTSKQIYKQNGNHKYRLYKDGELIGPEYTLDQMLYNGQSVKNGALEIYSIKRLSDNEIFTLGERGDKGNIIKIEFEKNGYMVPWIMGTKGGITLDFAIKYNKLFTTNDGIDIYKGDKFYFIENTKGFVIEVSDIEYDIKDIEKYHTFSTEKAAQNALNQILDAKLFSYNEIKDIYEKWQHENLLPISLKRILKK